MLLQRISFALGCYCAVGGCISLLGWALDLPRLADWGERNGIAMQPNTALAALLSGSAIVLLAFRMRMLAAGLGVVVLAIGIATLVEHATGLDLGIDRWLLFGRSWGTRATTSPGRMGLPGASSWALAGAAFVLLRKPGRTPTAIPVIAILIAAIAMLSLTGYLFGADMLFSLPRATAIALQTATILLAVGLALLLIASDRQPVQALLENTAAGALVRRALPVVICLPLVCGFFCVRGLKAGFYDASLALALLALLLIAAMCLFLSSSARAVRVREESLRRSEERFSRFMQHLPGLAWIKDSEGRYLYVNDAAADAFQRTPDQLQGRADGEIFPPETAAQFRTNDREALKSALGIQVIETLLHDDGVLHHSIVSKFPIRGAAGAAPMIGGMAIDITERKRAEETVQSLLKISALLNSTLDVDKLLEILVREAIGLVGAESGVSGLLTAEGMVSERYFQKGQAVALENRWPPGHGLPGWLIVHKRPYVTNDALTDPQMGQALCEQFGVRSAVSIPILSAQGSLLGFFEIHNKIDGAGFTQEDQDLLVAVSQVAAIAVQNALAYHALEEAEETLKISDQRKDEFLAVLAHELRNPLAPIRTGLEIMKGAEGKTEFVQDAQQAMDRQVTHLVRLVDDLLDISRINRDKLELRKERVELTQILRQAADAGRPLAASENQSIELSLPEKPIYLDADPIRLAQIFSNLLNNASKFSGRGARIWIAARQERGNAIVTVKDEGLGIQPDQLHQVFDLFTQLHQTFERSRGGLGIGLTLVRRLVEMHGGKVTVHSEGEGHGSEFVVCLPVIVETPPSVSHGAAGGAALAPRRVLIVDDNQDAAGTLGMLMKLEGHQTALAYDGQQACAVAESYRPEVILLDIGLPKMNGYDVCRSIRTRPWANNVVIIALTGWGQDDDRRKSSEAGFDGHLVKPVDLTQLMATLASLLPIGA